MNKFIVFIETTYTQYYCITELTTKDETETALKAEATKRAHSFIRALQYEHYNKPVIELYRITIFAYYSDCGNLIVYRSICEQPPKSKEFRANLDKTIYLFQNLFTP